MEEGKGESSIKLLNASWKRDKERKQLPCVSLIGAWENMASKTSSFPRLVSGEVSLSSSRRQLWEPLPKQVTDRAMLPDANESPNYFRQSIRGLTPQVAEGIYSLCLHAKRRQ